METARARRAATRQERDAASIARIIAMVAGVPRSQVNADYVRMVIESDRGSASWSDDVPVTVCPPEPAGDAAPDAE